jgi:predicted nucleic acid-binding Zn ribbon protein
MRKSKTLKIEEVISSFIREQGLENKMAENRLLNSWNDLLGKNVARLTRELYIRNSTLYVHLNSSVIRHELMMIKGDIIRRLNEKAGKEIITDIVLR